MRRVSSASRPFLSDERSLWERAGLGGGGITSDASAIDASGSMTSDKKKKLRSGPLCMNKWKIVYEKKELHAMER